MIQRCPHSAVGLPRRKKLQRYTGGIIDRLLTVVDAVYKTVLTSTVGSVDLPVATESVNLLFGPHHAGDVYSAAMYCRSTDEQMRAYSRPHPSQLDLHFHFEVTAVSWFITIRSNSFEDLTQSMVRNVLR